MSQLFVRGGGALVANICRLLALLSMNCLTAALLDQPDSDTSLGLSEMSLEDSQQGLMGQHGGSSMTLNRRLLATCKGSDISISQSQTSYTGIPTFTVSIVNTCVSSCAPWNIHLYCGSFASAELVNPNTFKRVAVNDCLVNNGNGLSYGNMLSFTYANSFKYPLRFKSMQWC